MDKFFPDQKRFCGASIYLLIAIGIFVFILNNKEIFFYLSLQEGFNNWPRLIWVALFSILGFSVVALRASRTPRPNEKTRDFLFGYLILYPIFLAGITIFVFILFNILNKTTGEFFYYASSATAFILAFHVHEVMTSFPKLLEHYLGNRYNNKHE